jgi:hypothetical protein
MNRKSRSRFALLPQSLREELNRKLDDGWQYEQIRHWLFELKADRDIPALNLKTGDPYSLVWTRTIPDEPRLIRNFGIALSGWYHTHFQQWRNEQSQRHHEGCLRVIRSADELAATVGATAPSPEATTGAQHLVNSLLLDALGKTSKGENPDPADLSRLAHAWARVNQTTLASKRLDLATEDTLALAAKALADDIKHNPEALALARQMFAAIESAKHPTTNPSSN